MKKLNQILREGVYDPIYLKFFGRRMVVVKHLSLDPFTGTGLKLVNSDTAFERGLKKANLSLKIQMKKNILETL